MVAQLQRVRGGRFVDERLLFGRWRSEATRDEIEMFFRSLAINHGVQVPRPLRAPVRGGGGGGRGGCRLWGAELTAGVAKPGLARVRRYGGVWLHEGVAY